MAKFNSLLKFCFTSILFISNSLASAQTPVSSAQNLNELKELITNIRDQTGVPGIGIALVDKNGPIWVDGVGLANSEQQIQATEETLFRVGSVSKLFTALAVMRLVEQGQLSLEERLSDVLPDLVYSNPWQDTHPIKVAHLLEHTTGWDVHTGEYAFEVDDHITLKEALNLHTDARVSRWAPGTRHSYSNTGPVVAARVVEKVTGMSFETYAQQAVFEPLEMHSSSYLKSRAFSTQGATGYYATGPVDYVHIYTRPSSTLNASPKALANALTMLVNRGQFNEQRFLAEETVMRMETPATTLGDRAGIHSGYGLGVDAFGFHDSNTAFYGHTGGVPGFASEFIYQPELGMGYAFVINQDNPQAFHQLSQALRAYIMRDPTLSNEIKTAPLPVHFTELQGFYTPINPILDIGRIAFDITDVIRIETDDQFLHRSPFFGGWRSNDYLPEGGNPNILYSAWSGLPAITLVDDPVSGRALQVEGLLYQKTSAVVVYGRIALLTISGLLILISIIYGFILSLRWLIKRRTTALINVYPVLLSLMLLAIPSYFFIARTDVNLIFSSTGLVFTILVVSTAYLCGPILGWWLYYRSPRKASRIAITVLGVHSFLVIYLLSYGLLPLNLWA